MTSSWGLTSADSPGATRPATRMAAALPALHTGAGVSEADGRTADAITALCDGIAFDFCFEKPESGTVASGHARLDGLQGPEPDPWPLSVPRLVGLVTAYDADGYPERLEPVVVPFSIVPGCHLAWRGIVCRMSTTSGLS